MDVFEGYARSEPGGSVQSGAASGRKRSGRIPLMKPAPPARWPPESGIADIAVYLTGDGAKTLEQEELDPEMPG
jgi:hypothetical protein